MLKLLHTNALVASDLSGWLEFLNEGQLDKLRSLLGKNEQFSKVGKALGWQWFLLTDKLGRYEVCVFDLGFIFQYLFIYFLFFVHLF